MLPVFYEHLETALDFRRKWIRTDCKFDSDEEAEKSIRFFFGDSLANRVAAERLTIVPECTGIWWKKID